MKNLLKPTASTSRINIPARTIRVFLKSDPSEWRGAAGGCMTVARRTVGALAVGKKVGVLGVGKTVEKPRRYIVFIELGTTEDRDLV